jgi:hypothetical protein
VDSPTANDFLWKNFESAVLSGGERRDYVVY